MGTKLDKFIGDESQFPMEHRVLNIAIIFVLIISIWGAITNYLLKLDFLLILTCIASSVIMALLYYLSFVKRQYTAALLILLIAGFVTTPVLWLLNGGIAGSIPFYIILFSSMGATVLWGARRIAVVGCFIVIASVLVIWEYKYPAIITNYSSVAERYTDILIGLLTTIIVNTVMIAIILKHYNKEHEKAKSYLAQSRQAQENLLYLSYHDALTGLHNRMYFEQEISDIERKKEYGVGIFAVDIDGLKFVNDTFGHEQGDLILMRAAKVLKASFRAHDIIARIGGDEYTAIIRGVAMHDMETMYKRIHTNLQLENEKFKGAVIPLHMSVGYAYSAGADKSIRDLIREADNKMYREKLYHQISTEGLIIQTVKKMLSACDFDADAHRGRLQNLIACFAKAAGLPASEIADIQLFAEFHDVGEIGVSDRILYKVEPLSKDEREQIRRHCEIGYRIAQASNELLPIADWILKHHEWWNGEGYPLGIKGEEIPVQCRIGAIADAYDAMTGDRAYRQSMSHEAAIEELWKCSGTQFDPGLVSIFVKLFAHDQADPGKESVKAHYADHIAQQER